MTSLTAYMIAAADAAAGKREMGYRIPLGAHMEWTVFEVQLLLQGCTMHAATT
jgi:hypothetical protein